MGDSLMAKIVSTALNSMSKAGGKSGENELQAAIAEGLAELHNYTDHALSKLEDRMGDVNAVVAANAEDLSNLTASDAAMHGQLGDAEAEAKTAIEAVKKKMAALETESAGYEADIASESEKQARQLQEQKAYLEQQQTMMIDELAKSNN